MVGLQALLALGVLGCANQPDDAVVVFAAASLRGAIVDAADRWDGDVRVSTAGSQVLRRQIEAGAPADVYIPASFAHATAASIAPMLDGPLELVCNDLVLVVAEDAPIHRFEELGEADRIVLGTPEVPVGAYADRAIERGAERWGASWRRRVMSRVVSREIDVRQVLAKVTLGEADAALVYGSNASEADVRRIDLPPGLIVRAHYPISRVRGASGEGARFSRWLRSEQGLEVLVDHGFVPCAVGDLATP